MKANELAQKLVDAYAPLQKHAAYVTAQNTDDLWAEMDQLYNEKIASKEKASGLVKERRPAR